MSNPRYTNHMHLAKATAAKRPKTLSVWITSLYLALFFIVAAVSQLFAYENYPSIMNSYGLPGLGGLGLLLAALIVILEVFAIPFLLFMRVSPLMRLVSMVCGWLAITFWLIVSIWIATANYYIPNAGLFGSAVPVPRGWWLFCFVVVLAVLVIYVSHAMWPIAKKRHKKVIVKPTA